MNREYKDRLFRLLFGSEQYKENTLSLYNALAGTDYDDAGDLVFNTINDSIYMRMKNDLSFLVRQDMELYEHQSTWNPNMPFRDFEYMAGLYDKYVEENGLDVYGSKELVLPTPRCVVFFNGDKETEDISELRLSSLFAEPEKSCIELVTTVYNINRGHNRELMGRCGVLRDYSEFVGRAKERMASQNDLSKAMNEVVDSCIRDGILADVLMARKAEVIEMCIREYDEIRHIENEKNISREEGISDSINKTVAIMKRLNAPDVRVIDELVREFGISRDEAETRLRMA